MSLLAFAECQFCFLAIGQVEHEGDTFLWRSFEHRHSDQYRHTATVPLDVFCLVGMDHSGRLQLGQASLVDNARFGGCQFRPTEALGDEIVAAVSSNLEKGFIRVNDPTVGTPDEDTDDIGVDQATHSCLPPLKFDEKFDEADGYGNHR